MIKKIIVLMILILISINNVNCESGNESIQTYISSSSEHTESFGIDNAFIGDFLMRLDLDVSGIPDMYKVYDIQMDNKTNYSATAGNVGDAFNIWYSADSSTKTELIGYGSFIIHKKSDAGIVSGEWCFNADITFYFDEIDLSGLSGQTDFILSTSCPTTSYYYYNFHYDTSDYPQVFGALDAIIMSMNYGLIAPVTYRAVKHEYFSLGAFRNDYEYNITSVYFDIDIQRTGFDKTYDLKSSKIKMVNYTDDTIYYQSGFTTSNSSHFLGVGSYNYYIVRNADNYEHLIYTFYEDDKDDEEQPTLTTDKTYYNTSELINISFTNIDSIYNECGQSICAKPYDLHILYPISHAYKDYESKYIYPLTYSLQDETISLSTSFLSPENTYILGIVGINGDYHKHEDILIFSDSFTVYSDEEYLSVSCDSETSCYTYNNADITIYYQINNNSNIIIKDNDNNIINTYYNIIGNGSMLYHIPDDLYHANTYPNWKVYLNNTEYSTSFNKGVTVYWSQFQTPIPTTTYTPLPTPDINISDTIDEFKTEIQPIKNLIFGLSEIVIDNPDYNKDNIVDESEINHWFNSLIPLCIIFLLIILYIGLKKNRND